MNYSQLTNKLGINKRKKIKYSLRYDSIYNVSPAMGNSHIGPAGYYIRIFYGEWHGKFDAYIDKNGIQDFINSNLSKTANPFHSYNEARNYINKHRDTGSIQYIPYANIASIEQLK